jgi:ubiquinone/menaquinone biosynthesis C-methylase UbiE
MAERQNLKEKNREQEIKNQDPTLFYREMLQKGLDYNFYGDWQKNYAKMIFNICEVIKRTGKAKPTMIDVGCACGVNTRGFKELNAFGGVMGCDISEFMIDLGRKTHGFTDKELFTADARNIPIRSNSVDFVHCTNVLEHCEEGEIRPILNEIRRIMQPEGIAFIVLPAITEKQTGDHIKEGNYDHKTIQPYKWWENLVSKQFELQFEIYDKFKYDKHSPDNSKKSFYDYYNEEWTIFLLTRR